MNEDSEYCTAPKGYQGKMLKKGDIGYGFTERGTTSNKHYPWRFSPYKSQYVHPRYRLVYDVDVDVKSNKPTRPKHIKGSKEYDQPKDILAAHHLIPVNEMRENDFLFKLLPQLGYDLNQTHNITVLPVLPELGCELGVQIHNSGHPNPYTDKVEALLNKLANKIKKSKACKPQTEQPSIHQQMEKISTKMLELINKNDSGKRPAEGIISQPGKWGDDYLAGNKGCRNKLLESEKTPLSKRVCCK